MLVEGTHCIFTFGAEPSAWDGRWTVVAFWLPEERRHTRHRLRTRLGWLGFALLYDAMWIAPGDRHVAAAALLAALDIGTATIVVGPAFAPPGDGPARAWDLAALGSRYEAFIEEFAPSATWSTAAAWRRRSRSSRGPQSSTSGARFPRWTRTCPPSSCPRAGPGPPREPSSRGVYDALGPLATIRFRQIVARHDEHVARLAVHHTVEEAVREATQSG